MSSIWGLRRCLVGVFVVAQGTVDEIMQNPASLTGQYLSGAKEIRHS